VTTVAETRPPQDVERHAPARRRRAAALVAGLPAAGVTLAWAAARPLPMIDDWSFILDTRRGTGLLWSSRPGEALLHWAVFRVADTHPLPPLLVLGALNVVVGALIWVLADRHWGPAVATLSALAWAVLPNRGSTRMWAACIPNLAAGALALGAIVLADDDELTGRRAVLVIALAGASCLTYEGAAALAAAAVLWAALHRPSQRSRWATTVGGLAVLAACAAWVVTHTPKTGGVHIAANGSRLVSTQFGVGLWPGRASVLGVVVFAAIVFAVAAPVLGRPRRAEESAIAWGAVIMALGAAVFLVTGFPLSDAGLFDRGNVYTDIGTAIVIGGLLALAWRRRAPLGAALAAVVLGLLTVGNVAAVEGFARSAADARAVLRDVRALPQYPAEPIAIGPLPDHDGVAGFTAAYDITDALAVRYPSSAVEQARVTVTDGQAAALVGSEAVYRYCPGPRALIPWTRAC
jgi:hypothetical protein